MIFQENFANVRSLFSVEVARLVEALNAGRLLRRLYASRRLGIQRVDDDLIDECLPVLVSLLKVAGRLGMNSLHYI